MNFNFIIALFLILITIIIIGIIAISFRNKNRLDIDWIIYDIYTLNSGYSNKISKYINKDLFDTINLYNLYSTTHGKNITVDITMKEIKQKKIFNTIYIYKNINFKVLDENDDVLFRNINIPVIFTIKIKDDCVFIEKINEYYNKDDVPMFYSW